VNIELLKQVDYCLSKCGRPVPPPGLSALYLYRGIPVQIQLATASSQTIVREIAGETDFELAAIQMSTTATTALYLQVQLPDGRFLFSNLLDITQVAGFGSFRYSLTKPLLCPPGTRFVLTFDTTLPAAGSTQPSMVLFEGADRYLLTGGSPSKCPEARAAQMPRIFGDGNQNILAPCWQQGFTPDPPPGFEDEIFTYASAPLGQGLGPATITIGSTLSTSCNINIDLANDFEVRRFLIWVTADATVTGGVVLCRIRLGSGYAVTDDYIDVASYIGSAPFAKDLHVEAGDQIFFDLILVDATGTGNFQFQAFAEGLKRYHG
jgi:hypothetical protein